MHVISRKALRAFGQVHPDAESPLRVWYKIVSKTRFTTPAEVKELFPKACILPSGIVIFNAGGKSYRLSVRIEYALGQVYIRRVVTHAEYEKHTRDGTL